MLRTTNPALCRRARHDSTVLCFDMYVVPAYLLSGGGAYWLSCWTHFGLKALYCGKYIEQYFVFQPESVRVCVTQIVDARPGTAARLPQRSTWMSLWAKRPPRSKREESRSSSPGSTWTSWRSTRRPGRAGQKGARRRACEPSTRS